MKALLSTFEAYKPATAVLLRRVSESVDVLYRILIIQCYEAGENNAKGRP